MLTLNSAIRTGVMGEMESEVKFPKNMYAAVLARMVLFQAGLQFWNETNKHVPVGRLRKGSSYQRIVKIIMRLGYQHHILLATMDKMCPFEVGQDFSAWDDVYVKTIRHLLNDVPMAGSIAIGKHVAKGNILQYCGCGVHNASNNGSSF